jgi:endonuclease G
MTKLVLLAMTVLIHGHAMASSQSYCDENKGIVAVPNTAQPYCYQDFMVAYSVEQNNPLQASYVLSPDTTYTSYPFNKTIQAPQATSAGFDRERAAHKAGYDFTALAPVDIEGIDKRHRNSELNRIPMEASLNRNGGVWDALKQYELTLPIKIGTVHVTNGAIFENNDFIPTAFYKIIFQPDLNMLIAFMVPNNSSENKGINQYISTLGCIERASGAPLLSNSSVITKEFRWAKAFGTSAWADGSNINKTCVGE